jgi:opacity protein-like surface antigen
MYNFDTNKGVMNRGRITISIVILLGAGMCAHSTADAGVSLPDDYFSAEIGTSVGSSSPVFDESSTQLEKSSSVRTAPVGAITWGEMFFRYFAVEVSYWDLGYIKSGLASVPGATPAKGEFHYSARGPSIAAVGMIPFGNHWEADLKLGTLLANSHLALYYSDDLGKFADKDSAWNAGLMAVVGLKYYLNENWSLSLDGGDFRDLGKKDTTGQWTLRTLTFAASYYVY